MRALLYLAESYHELFENRLDNLYGSGKINLPEPELYMIYTGNRENRPMKLTLSDSFFNGRMTAVEVTVKVLYGDNRENIIGQYVRFCKVFNEQVKIYGQTRETVCKTIEICKSEKVLSSYLSDHEKEAVNIMMTLFDEEYIQKAYGEEKKAEGKAEANRLHINNMRKSNLSDEQISAYLGLSLSEVKAVPVEETVFS